ncbi:NAD(P)/FAD-dependent oxidoreductase [Paracoccus suum]|uniref:Thioredoxin reductase n=1 Tax=Paracoccus suum TaxID=2259340 RepID=A0A344PJR1_9RHOB|nr:NAD(P)/FAD-dependent oxidoreductase [Paracoccus suum]AXC49616.1 NAD(P)/FAD-dependent oxidoreductase [Paracoccus suum]
MTKRDCVIVGGGPAGLTAAIYLARFCRSLTVIDADEGRLAMIPLSHNHPGFPKGIAGCDLLDRMRAQAREYGAEVTSGRVTALAGKVDGFTVTTEDGTVLTARTVLLATGVVNRRPPLADDVHADAVARGLLRYCPICDGFEQQDKRIGVLGADSHGMAEALFLRGYSKHLTMLTLIETDLDAGERAQLKGAGITLEERPLAGLTFAPPGEDESGGVRVSLQDGGQLTLDTLYPALGSETRNTLGLMLGTEVAEGACFVTDDSQRTSVAGIYAAGDAIEGLDQISVATGTGAKAAVAIHNDLRERDGQTAD